MHAGLKRKKSYITVQDIYTICIYWSTRVIAQKYAMLLVNPECMPNALHTRFALVAVKL